MLKFRIEGQKLTWENPDEVVVAGTKKYLECYFEFDGDAWSGFEYIEAFFKNGRDKPIRMLLSANRIWKEDGLCLTAGDWSVYLRAVVSKKKVDEEGNVVYEEDGVTPVMELEKQITSSSVSIRVLAHGQFEDAQNSFKSPEIAEQYIEQMLDIGNAMSVFEEYDPEKEYFKHNRVAFEGASYVLIAESAQGINPTDTGSWLCIAEKGDKGEQGVQGIKGDKGEQGVQGIKGEKGDKGKDGTLWTPLYFELDIKKGENKKAQFDFNRNILYFGYEEYGGLNKDDYPNVYEWTVGDFFVSNDRKILQIKQLEWPNSEFLNVDVTCISEHNLIVDQVFDWNSENALSGKALAGVLETLSKEVAMVDLSNVTNADFKAKAEEAGVGGDAGLAEEKCIMEFMGTVSELPDDAEEGQVYSVSPWESIGVYDGTGVFLGAESVSTDGWGDIANVLQEDISQYGGNVNYKFVLSNGTEFTYKKCDVGGIGEWGFEIRGECSEFKEHFPTQDWFTVPEGTTIAVYKVVDDIPDNVSYVRFNGKWIKL